MRSSLFGTESSLLAENSVSVRWKRSRVTSPQALRGPDDVINDRSHRRSWPTISRTRIYVHIISTSFPGLKWTKKHKSKKYFHCGQLVLGKISKFARCHQTSDLRLKCTKFDFCSGSAPDPAGGAYSAPPDLLAGFNGPETETRQP